MKLLLSALVLLGACSSFAETVDCNSMQSCYDAGVRDGRRSASCGSNSGVYRQPSNSYYSAQEKVSFNCTVTDSLGQRWKDTSMTRQYTEDYDKQSALHACVEGNKIQMKNKRGGNYSDYNVIASQMCRNVAHAFNCFID